MARVVMFVLNDCRTDARVLREAATLVAAGHGVTVMARTSNPYADGVERETRDGFEIVRVPVASGALRWLLLPRRPASLLRALAGSARRAAGRPPRGWFALGAGGVGLVAAAPFAALAALALGTLVAAVRLLPPARWAWLVIEWRLKWRFGVTAWAAGAAAAAPPGDVFHAHDLTGLPAAIAARDRGGGAVVYDSHEVFVEAGANAERPRAARAAMRALERRLANEAAALVTVNDDVAQVLRPALGMEGRTVIVRNCPPRWDPPVADPALLRLNASIPAEVPLILSHGLLVADRGLEQIAAALRRRELAGVHAVLMGPGPLVPHLRALAADPALEGRLHVLDAVAPDQLAAWVHGADLVVTPIQPSTLNHRLSTPNKLFEALGAGVPVVASDFPPIRRIVIDDPDGPLGAVCDPTDPAAIAATIRALLDLPSTEMADLRRRCLAAAHARYAWEIDAARLVALYELLAPPPPPTVPA